MSWASIKINGTLSLKSIKKKIDKIFNPIKSDIVKEAWYGAIKSTKTKGKIYALIVAINIDERDEVWIDEMDESENPFYYNCPNEILDLLTKTNDKNALLWRKTCRESNEIKENNKIINVSTGGFHMAAIKKNGTVVTAGDNEHGQCNVSKWKNITAISTGHNHTVGLKKNGTVVATGKNDYGQCNVSKWKNIIAISAGYDHTVGLKKDGTVVAVGKNKEGQCNVLKWKNIVAISAGVSETVGLEKDGTVLITNKNKNGEYTIEDWNNN